MALPTSQHNVTVRKLSSTLNSYNTKVNTKIGGKADKVQSATSGNFAGLDSNGNLTDSGKKASDFATSAQGTKADSAIQSVKVEGTALTPDTNKAVNVTKTSLGLNNVTNDAQVKRSEMGVANGVATLGSDGKVPSAQLPSFVDDVIEGYYYDAKFYRDSGHTEEITPAAGIIYVDLPTNKTYRWSGSAYVEISASLALGETSSTAYRGDRGKTAYDHSQLTSGNPHNVSKSDVGLGNVDNKSEATIKSDFTGAVADGNTGFPTGDAVYEAISANGKGVELVGVSNTFSEVKAIRTAGKLPIYVYTHHADSRLLPLSGGTVVDASTEKYTFSAVYDKKLYSIELSSADGWGTLSVKDIETEDDKVTSWSSTTTDTHYPSEKLVKTSLDSKVDKVSGKQLSTEDYTTAEKNKLAGISTGANKVVVDENTANGYITIDGTPTAVYTHPTTAGNKHIPSGGSSGQFLGYDSAGTAKWVNNPIGSISDVKIGFGAASATLGTSPAFTASLSNYTLDAGNGGIVAIKFSNDVPASATLNINSKGAKAIYYQGAAITAGVVQSGDTAFLMYNGTQYVLLGTDRSVQEMTDTEVTDLVDALT